MRVRQGENAKVATVRLPAPASGEKMQFQTWLRALGDEDNLPGCGRRCPTRYDHCAAPLFGGARRCLSGARRSICTSCSHLRSETTSQPPLIQLSSPLKLAYDPPTRSGCCTPRRALSFISGTPAAVSAQAGMTSMGCFRNSRATVMI